MQLLSGCQRKELNSVLVAKMACCIPLFLPSWQQIPTLHCHLVIRNRSGVQKRWKNPSALGRVR